MFPDMNPAVVRRAPFPAQAHHKRCGKCGKLVSKPIQPTKLLDLIERLTSAARAGASA